MTTSGSTDYSINARELVSFALKTIGVIDSITDPSSADARDTLQAANMMLKSLQSTAPNLWRQTFGSVTLTTASSYTVTPRPFRIHEMRYRDTNSRDLPMYEMTREEYVELPLKTSTGIPTSFYVDYQRDVVTVYVWPVLASATTESLQFTYQRRFEDLDSLDNDIDVPQESLETLGYMLADRVMNMFGKDRPKVTARAERLFEDLKASDREPYVRFVPDRSR
jgi:hypothetical protein